MIVIALLFGMLLAGASYIMGKESRKMESSELSTYIVLLSWGSLIVGLFIARMGG